MKASSRAAFNKKYNQKGGKTMSDFKECLSQTLKLFNPGVLYPPLPQNVPACVKVRKLIEAEMALKELRRILKMPTVGPVPPPDPEAKWAAEILGDINSTPGIFPIELQILAATAVRDALVGTAEKWLKKVEKLEKSRK